ncbi:MAG: hypothetical protein E6I17_07175 [Chloroflexi bacterium]|nr:MAG: hypothetical protein E6I17_07175 [Chloroflexota bacterium]
MPKPDSSLSAVIVSGGKQYRVAPGDQILVDRLAAEPGSSVKGVGLPTEEKEDTASAAKPKGRAKAAARKRVATKAEVVAAERVVEEKVEAPPKKPTRRTAKKETK